MVHYRRKPGRMHYGTGSAWERPHDRGGPPDQVRGRLAIQHSQESLRVLAKRYGINQKTVAKWKRRTAVKDLPTGPRDIHSTVLTIEEEKAAWFLKWEREIAIIARRAGVAEALGVSDENFPNSDRCYSIAFRLPQNSAQLFAFGIAAASHGPISSLSHRSPAES